MSNKKLLVIGFDGATFDVILKNIDELPTFKRLLEDSSYGILESVIPPITIPAFPCLAASKTPDYFKTYTFYTFNKNTKELKLWKETMIEDRFWDILSDNGYNCILFNIPASYPYKKDFNGMIVAAAPEAGKKSYSYPPELWRELNNHVGGGLKLRPENSAVDPDYIKEIIELEDKRVKAINYLLENNSWDFAMIFLRQTDRIAHRWWYSGELLKAYQRADNHLKEIICKYDCDTIIFSDHGFEGLHTSINLGYILLSEGLITLKGKKWYRVVLAWLREKVSNFAKKYGFISILRRITPQTIIEKTPHGNILTWFNVLAHKMVDFERTEVMPISAGKVISLYVFGDKKQVKQKIKNCLDKLGFRYELRELNNHDPRVPDLILEAKDKGYFFYTHFDAQEPVSKVKKSTHNKEGIIIVNGKSFKKGEIKEARLIDLAPTILHYFGIPIPISYEGKVLQIFSEDSEMVQRKIKYRDYEKERIKQKIKRLKSRL
jgi:predicted AlkP superfamily phosphohydrolase/phosphomutase